MASSANPNVRKNLDIETLGREAYDPFAKALTVTDSVHRAAHDGFVYHASGKVASILDTAVDDFLIKVPQFSFPHFQRFRLFAGRGGIDIVVYEGVTTTVDGSAVASFNTNRNSTNTPNVTLFSGPTVTDLGTLVHTSWIVPTSSGTGQSGPTGIAGETNGEEWILKHNTEYLIRITNNSGSDISYAYEMLWYELDY